MEWLWLEFMNGGDVLVSEFTRLPQVQQPRLVGRVQFLSQHSSAACARSLAWSNSGGAGVFVQALGL